MAFAFTYAETVTGHHLMFLHTKVKASLKISCTMDLTPVSDKIL